MNALETFAQIRAARDAVQTSVPDVREFDERCQLIHKLDLALSKGDADLARALTQQLKNLRK